MEVKNYFQQRADEFDALYDEGRTWRYYLDRLLRQGLFARVHLTLQEMASCQDFTVLDVGCGSGRNSALFVEAGARKVVGIDFSQRMIDLAMAFSRARGVASQCDFIKADFLSHPVEKKFDIVVALGVFDYVSDPVPFLQKMVASSTSQIIASFPGMSIVRAPTRKLRYALRGCPLYFYSARQLNQICQDIGMASYRVIPYASSGLLLVGQVEGTD